MRHDSAPPSRTIHTQACSHFTIPVHRFYERKVAMYHCAIAAPLETALMFRATRMLGQRNSLTPQHRFRLHRASHQIILDFARVCDLRKHDPMPLPHPLSQPIISYHDASLARADAPPVAAPDPAADSEVMLHRLMFWIGTNHHFNSKLWAEEDLARRTTVSDSEIAANKRAIDKYNQARNDATERVDEILLTELHLVDAASAHTDAPVSKAPPHARLNSETAGSIIDRMSIMALKIHAMRLQVERTDVDAAHRSSSKVKVDKLIEQRNDLASCLDALLSDSLHGRAYFKVYRQFKMYNDARFNPALVAEQAAQRKS
ncbi:DUF4254 domain-containing protein [Aquabacterium sp. NJ1]|uniref:DUF4254 domain-containing protein n=1 Tax=Aquabacterium sp. NJ1 TaxID=1538295 RepID=UPI001F355A57|nr:DUF4254 domain-containing protein [Aquabacterium sp. NJ1]